MPLATNPDRLYRIVLESDSKIPEAEQPCFIFRYLSGRQWEAVACVQDSLEQCENAKILSDKVYGAAATGLVGWENMRDPGSGEPILFNPDNITDGLKNVIGMIEAQELIARLLKQTPDFEDKKKSDLQLPSGTAGSVETAEGPSNAATNQQPSNPSRPNV